MFDIGFTELVLIGVVGLLVIGPERLPSAIRTGSVWLGRLRRSFNDIKREVEQEIHNDTVLQELKRSGEQVRDQALGLQQEVRDASKNLSRDLKAEPDKTLPRPEPNQEPKEE